MEKIIKLDLCKLKVYSFYFWMPKLIKIKGDASFRSFFRKKVNGKSSIVVYAKKEKFKNLLVYDAVNKILSKNNYDLRKFIKTAQ